MKSSKNPQKNEKPNPTPVQPKISRLKQPPQNGPTNTMGRNAMGTNENTHKSKHYLHLSNEQFLVRNLKLLDVSEQQFLKQTKTSLSDSSKIFPKSLVNPTASKQFFFISFVCLQRICGRSEDQIAPLAMWYPPRTVNEQLQFKKTLFKVIQNLQILGKLPKNLLVSKGTIMGDNSSATLVEFLRILSQIALRSEYIERYSKKQRLIQIACGVHEQNKPQNDINRFYIHPFTPNGMQPPPHLNLDSMKSIYHHYIKIYLRKLAKLRTKTVEEEDKFNIEHQLAMKSLMEQKQLHKTLSEKIPKKILSENRSFDRRRIIDQNKQIWEELSKIECNFVEKSSMPVLKVEGEIDCILKKWQPAKGIANILQANSLMDQQYSKLKSRCQKQMKQFEGVKEKIRKALGLGK